MRSQSDLESLHRFCTRNREALEHSERAGCFYCGALFDPAEIKYWIDGRQVETGDTQDGVTALCPRCGIDAVLAETTVVSLNRELLDEMNAYWFH